MLRSAVHATPSAVHGGLAAGGNGTLVRIRNPGVGAAHAKYATACAENERVAHALPPGVLVSGESTVAVLVRQNGGTSPDLSFDLRRDVAQIPPR